MSNLKIIEVCSGSDTVIYINGVSVNEILRFKFDSLKKDKQIELDIGAFSTILEDNSILKELENGTIIQEFILENGQKYRRDFLNVTFQGIKVTADIDDIILHDTYVYSCDKMTDYYKYEGEIN